jgi:hypothetical protein
MAPNRRLKRIDLYCPEYKTNASLRINNEHPSGHPHLETTYEKGGTQQNDKVAAAIPDDWTDQDLLDLISLPQRQGTGRDWPAWEIPAADYARFSLFRFWRGERPRE